MEKHHEHGLLMKYFVLKPKGKDVYARASRKAIRAYAMGVYAENPQLAKDLRDWADTEMLCAEAVHHSEEEKHGLI